MGLKHMWQENEEVPVLGAGSSAPSLFPSHPFHSLSKKKKKRCDDDIVLFRQSTKAVTYLVLLLCPLPEATASDLELRRREHFHGKLKKWGDPWQGWSSQLKIHLTSMLLVLDRHSDGT